MQGLQGSKFQRGRFQWLAVQAVPGSNLQLSRGRRCIGWPRLVLPLARPALGPLWLLSPGIPFGLLRLGFALARLALGSLWLASPWVRFSSTRFGLALACFALGLIWLASPWARFGSPRLGPGQLWTRSGNFGLGKNLRRFRVPTCGFFWRNRPRPVGCI